MRLLHLIIHEKLGNTDVVHFEGRSIKRELAKADKAYRVEKLMISYLVSEKKIMLSKEREKLWKKYQPLLFEIRGDVYERQLLKTFDFTAWLEADIRRVDLREVLKTRSKS